jgi:hypothetical protein
MKKWQKSEQKLAANHGWRAAPGHRICVLDRGDLQFEFPQGWHLTPEEGAIKVTDKPPPNDDCVLRVSVLRFGPLTAGHPSLLMLLQGAFVEAGHLLDASDVQRVDREDIEILWGEYREIDSKENREAVWRIAMSHSISPTRNLYGFLTFGFWPEDTQKATAFWVHALKTMIMDRPVADPARGPQFH